MVRTEDLMMSFKTPNGNGNILYIILRSMTFNQ